MGVHSDHPHRVMVLCLVIRESLKAQGLKGPGDGNGIFLAPKDREARNASFSFVSVQNGTPSSRGDSGSPTNQEEQEISSENIHGPLHSLFTSSPRVADAQTFRFPSSSTPKG